jgi:hypothetical protein
VVAAVLVPLIILAVCLAAVLAVAWRLSTMVVSPKMWDYNTTFDEEISRGAFTLEKYRNEYRGEEFYIDSSFGYKIHAMVIPQKAGTHFADGRARVAVIAHGYSYTLYGSIKYADFFHDLGFVCVVYDERNHGKTGKAPTSMGYYEARDLSDVCAWARERYGEDCVLGTHGESMGAAIVMMHAPTDSGLAFVIEDCGYSDLADELAHQLKMTLHLPRWPVLPLADIMVKMRGGVRLQYGEAGGGRGQVLSGAAHAVHTRHRGRTGAAMDGGGEFPGQAGSKVQGAFRGRRSRRQLV